MRAFASSLSVAALLLSCCSVAAIVAGITAGVAVGTLAGAARAQDLTADGNDIDLSYHALAEKVANTSIIWVNDDGRQMLRDSSLSQVADSFGQVVAGYLNHQGIQSEAIKATAIYESLGAFAMPVAPEDARRALQGMQQDEAEASFDKSRAMSGSLSVTPDMIVSIMDANDCADKAAMELEKAGIQADTVPNGVKRVGGGDAAPDTGYPRKVWIIDTGLDNASNFIRVDIANAANCTKAKGGTACAPSSAASFERDLADKIGHGTMLAGIIGATSAPAGAGTVQAGTVQTAMTTGAAGTGPSLRGVAPGATIVPVKIFGSQPNINLSGPPLAALDYVAARAAENDIINMSWGAAWLEGMDREPNNLATVLGAVGNRTGLIARIRKMIDDKHLTFVVAAGNVDAVTRPSWVQFVMPAGAGSYPKPNAGCSLCTVSAADSQQDGATGKWTDIFWYDHAVLPTGAPRFGSDYGHNPPDFAEPGVGVMSLWPRGRKGANRINACSGTSFAAAHLSGILVRGEVAADYTVTGDPDSPDDAKMADPMGILAKSAQSKSAE